MTRTRPITAASSRCRHFKRTLSTILALVLATCACTASAVARTGPLIAELVEYTEIRSIIPPQTFETFSRTCRLTPAQADAAKDLVLASRDDLARVINRHLRTVRDDPTLPEILASESRVVKDAGEVEGRMLAELKAILSPEQVQTSFDRFERLHRRSLLRITQVFSLPPDLDGFFASTSFDPATDPQLVSVLERAELDIDAALVRQRRGLVAYYANIRAPYDNSEQGAAKRDEVFKTFQIANDGLDRALAKPVEAVLERVPEAVGDRLAVDVLTRRLKDFDATLTTPDRYPVAREVLAMNLSADQRAAAKAIVDQAKQDIVRAARTAVVEEARYLLADNAKRQTYKTQPTNVFLGDAAKIRTTTSRDLLALLSPEQRSVYDASDVIDPSETSKVK